MTCYQLHQRRFADAVTTGDKRNLTSTDVASKSADHGHIPVAARELIDVKQTGPQPLLPPA